MMKALKVKALRALLADAPDDAVVMVPAHDHAYRLADVEVTTALQENRYSWTEDHGEEMTPEAEYGRRIPIILVT